MADLTLVEDDPDLGDILAEILRSRGHEVRVGRNGREALKLEIDRLLKLVDRALVERAPPTPRGRP